MARILIIDDEESVRKAVETIAVAAGHETRCAADGRQGMVEFFRFQPDLVVTDLLMPEKEGIETIIDLRKQWPDLPIIAISGGGRMGDTSGLKMAEHFGATLTISKPFAAAHLRAAFSICLTARADNTMTDANVLFRAGDSLADRPREDQVPARTRAGGATHDASA